VVVDQPEFVRSRFGNGMNGSRAINLFQMTQSSNQLPFRYPVDLSKTLLQFPIWEVDRNDPKLMGMTPSEYGPTARTLHEVRHRSIQ
jgi:hypothetical protein